MLTDSDLHRQHDLAKPRLWKWRNSLNFCVNSIIPYELGTTKPFSADLKHLALADIERQFSFEVEQHRDHLKEELIKQKRLIEDRRMEIQSRQMLLEKQVSNLSAQLEKNQQEIELITGILNESPQVKRKGETGHQFDERKKSWPTREPTKVKELVVLFTKYDVTVSEKTTHIDEALKLKGSLTERQAKLLKEIEQTEHELSALSKEMQGIIEKGKTSQAERQLAAVSTTINAATVGISLILRKASDSNNYVLFSPLLFKDMPIVFSSSSLTGMKSKFSIITPQRIDFATDLAKRLEVDKTQYSDTIASYSRLKDTETTAINYLLSNPGDEKYVNVLHKTIYELLNKNGYSYTDVQSLCVHIHTKKDPCGLCTRLIEGLYLELNKPRFILPKIKTTLKNVVLVSSCEDYRTGKARELFLRNDTAQTETASSSSSSSLTTAIIKPFDLSESEEDYLFFKLLYGGF